MFFIALSLPQTTKAYGASLEALIQDSQQPIVIVVDSLEAVAKATDLDWIPANLPANVKLIITVTETEEGQRILGNLTGRISSTENVLHLTSFSEEQWREVISRGTINLPEELIEAKEKTPIHAKVNLNSLRLFLLPSNRCLLSDSLLDGLAGNIAGGGHDHKRIGRRCLGYPRE